MFMGLCYINSRFQMFGRRCANCRELSEDPLPPLLPHPGIPGGVWLVSGAQPRGTESCC